MAMAAELSAGRSPAEALAAAASLDVPATAEASRVSALGGDPVAVLRRGSASDGAGSLRHVAAAWRLSGTTGAPLADVLRRASLVVRDEVAAMREVEEQMAPVRATGRVLAALPLMGMVIGGAFGVNVPLLLLTTTWGQLCLVVALGLVAAGLWAIDRIGDHVTRT
jgi:tight adherence protein B